MADYPFVATILFEESHHKFKVAVEADGVPVCEVKEPFAVWVRVPVTVTRIDELVRPSGVYVNAFTGLIFTVEAEVVGIVVSKPALWLGFNGGWYTFALEGFPPGYFEDNIAIVTGFEGLLDDVGQVDAVEVVEEECGPLAVVEVALDVELHAGHTGTVVVDGGCDVDLFGDFIEDGDGVGPALQNDAGVWQAVDGAYEFAVGGLAGGDFDEALRLAGYFAAFCVVEHYVLRYPVKSLMPFPWL